MSIQELPSIPLTQPGQHSYSKSKSLLKLWDSSQNLNLWFIKVIKFLHIIKCSVEICLVIWAGKDRQFYFTEDLDVSKSGFPPVPNSPLVFPKFLQTGRNSLHWGGPGAQEAKELLPCECPEQPKLLARRQPPGKWKHSLCVWEVGDNYCQMEKWLLNRRSDTDQVLHRFLYIILIKAELWLLRLFWIYSTLQCHGYMWNLKKVHFTWNL